MRVPNVVLGGGCVFLLGVTLGKASGGAPLPELIAAGVGVVWLGLLRLAAWHVDRKERAP